MHCKTVYTAGFIDTAHDSPVFFVSEINAECAVPSGTVFRRNEGKLTASQSVK